MTTWRSKYSDLNFSHSSLKAILLDVWPLVAQTLTRYCSMKLLLSSLTGLKSLKSNSHFSCTSNSFYGDEHLYMLSLFTIHQLFNM